MRLDTNRLIKLQTDLISVYTLNVKSKESVINGK